MSILVAACGPDPVTEDVATSAVTDARWSCTIGTQGGFSGGGDGYEVHSDGQVLRWTRATSDAGTTREHLGVARRTQLDSLQQLLFAPELHAIEFNRSGNLTHLLEVSSEYTRTEKSAPGSGPEDSARQQRVAFPTRRWTWPADRMGGNTRAKVPSRVEACYEAVHAVVRSIEATAQAK